MPEYGWALALVAFLIGVFLVSNYVHTRTATFVLSRKVAHFGAGVPIILFPLLFSGMLYPVLLPGLFLLLLLVTHRQQIFHGFAMRGRLAELWFPFSIMVCMASAWSMDPWVAVAAALMLAWGDGWTGLARWLHHRGQAGFKKYWCGTWAMLATCLLVAVLVSPYWIGALGAVVATGAERYEGIDDNLTSPLAALAVMAPLYTLAG